MMRFSLLHVGPSADVVEGNVVRLDVFAEVFAARSLAAAQFCSRVMAAGVTLLLPAHPEVSEFSDRLCPTGKLRVRLNDRLTEVLSVYASVESLSYDFVDVSVNTDRFPGGFEPGNLFLADFDPSVAQREQAAFLASDVPTRSELLEHVNRLVDQAAQPASSRVRLVFDACPVSVDEGVSLLWDRILLLQRSSGADEELLPSW